MATIRRRHNLAPLALSSRTADDARDHKYPKRRRRAPATKGTRGEAEKYCDDNDKTTTTRRQRTAVTAGVPMTTCPTTADAPAPTAQRQLNEDMAVTTTTKRRQDSDDRHRRQHGRWQNTSNLPGIENSGWHPRLTVDTRDGTATTRQRRQDER